MLFCDRPDELKKNFSGGVVVVRGPDLEVIREALALSGIARNILLVGDRVHLFVDEPEARIAELRVYLDGKGVLFQSIEQVAPSVEDVFVSAVREQQEA
jgi:ABC-2 type transport system ATP-binding protein